MLYLSMNKNNSTVPSTAKETEYTYLKVPSSEWNLLEETLYMDTQSSMFDYELREELTEALETVQTIREPLTLTTDERKMVSELIRMELDNEHMFLDLAETEKVRAHSEKMISKLNWLLLKIMVEK